MLIPARTDTKWWWDWVKDKATLFWIKGRVKFGEHSVGAPFPSVLALYMKDIKGGSDNRDRGLEENRKIKVNHDIKESHWI